jgi:hypothetical protein
MAVMRYIFILILSPSFFQAQMLDPKKSEPLSDQPFFDDDFIRWQKIKSLKGKYMFMPIEGGIVTTDFWIGFEFDTLGRLSNQFETLKNDGTSDTTWNYYSYDEKSRLIESKKCYLEECILQQKYWGEDDIIKIKQEINTHSLKAAELIFRDSIQTQQSEFLTIQKYYNSSGHHYCMEETKFDYLHRPIFISKRLLNTSAVTNEIHTYDINGKLISLQLYQGTDSTNNKTDRYSYDEAGNLIKQYKAENDKITKEVDFLYNDIGKLESIITQDYEYNLITVIRFSEISFY